MQYEGVVDVFQTARILRTQRPAMVQTEVVLDDVVFVRFPYCESDFSGPVPILLSSCFRIFGFVRSLHQLMKIRGKKGGRGVHRS